MASPMYLIAEQVVVGPVVGGGREEQEELSIGMTVLGTNGIFTPATSCHDTSTVMVMGEGCSTVTTRENGRFLLETVRVPL
jgi:hypothetical protein